MAKVPQDIINAAIASERKWGIPASVSLAQWAVESAWGAKHLGVFNYFGMKARKRNGVIIDPYVIKRTREVIKGKTIYIDDAFRKFASPQAAFDAHGELLATAKVYAKARAKLPDARAFADALTGVYATDPNYGKVLKQVMGGSANLYAYSNVKEVLV